MVQAQLPVPRLQSVFPPGARSGTTIEVEIAGANLDDTTKLYFSHPEITAKLLSADKDKLPHFQVTVAAAVPVGDYDVRTIGKFGISNPRAFVIGDLAEGAEKEPNNQRAQATRVNLNNVINGRISPSEDVDWFAFSAKQGQRILIECRAWRIDSRLDGFMWLYNSEGKQIAASQDEDIRNEKRDPMIDFVAPSDGDYFVKLTDFTFAGGPDFFYHLSISTLPYVDFIEPSGAQPGGNATITVFGRNLPEGEKTDWTINGHPLEKVVKRVDIPRDAETLRSLRYHEVIRAPATKLDGMEVRVANAAGTSNAGLLTFSALPEVLEQEPNNATNQAQRLTVPCALSGRFNRPRDVDYYVFAAKKKDLFDIEVFGERIGSPADPDMEVWKPDGKLLANPQDFNYDLGQLRFHGDTRDIYYTMTAPADGDYTLRLEHLFGQTQGGEQYTYRLEIVRDPLPDFRLICSPTDEIRMDSHVVYQGGRQRLDILVWRLSGHDEPITVAARNLPSGVTADPIVIGKGIKWGTLVVSAAPDAPLNEAEIQIVGESDVKGQKLVREARGGVIVWDTVNTPALSRMTHSIMLAVREKTPFAITATPTSMTISQGEPINLLITAERRADVTNPIQLTGAGYQLPPGMEVPLTKIDPSQTEVKLTLSTDKIKEGTYSFLINGEAQVPTGKDKNTRCVYPSNTIKLTIEPKRGK